MCSIEIPANDADANLPSTVLATASGAIDYCAFLSKLKRTTASADGESEIWKPVVGWESDFEVSNRGRVRRVTLVSFKDRRYGYQKVTLRIESEKRYKTFFVHRLVLEAFKGPCPPGKEGCHNNGARDDNRVENLRWDTRINNFVDREIHGNTARGERNGNSRLKREQVRWIRSMQGKYPVELIAKQIGWTTGSIYNIWKGKTWKNVT